MIVYLVQTPIQALGNNQNHLRDGMHGPGRQAPVNQLLQTLPPIPDEVEKTIRDLKQFNRPVICTEWLNRPAGSTVESVLPLFFEENIGCLHWGLVNGKTQTNLPWGHRPGDGPYRGIWQHDLYTNDLQIYSPYEIQLFKSYISKLKLKQTSGSK